MTLPARDRLLVIGAVVVPLLAWAFVIRALAGAFDPGALTLGRLAVAAVVLGGVQLARGGWVRPTRREWLLLAAFGLSWFLIYNLALNAAEHELDAGTAALLVNVAPLIVALVAGTLLGEGFPRWLMVGALVAFGGVALIGAATATGALSVTGVLLALAAVTYAIAVLLQKPLLRRLPGLQMTFIGVAIGTVGSLPWAGPLVAQVGAASAAEIAGVVYLGVVPTAIAFLAWAYALGRMPAGRLITTTYLVPVLATAAAWPLLGEVPPPLALIGGLVCLVGVALTRLPDRALSRRPAPAATAAPRR
ncbi:DMT family transporter [Agrococcus sp. TF02-05]|uniref:DMT family transporter n=1 Tax=Agrococcus sp. TF02-05 TaxID=2815211 RepID=UPI001AA197D1|nr:DMT family transporter [Agrococcus sp. TF02-05]MBO1770843.1 DMT family transporter [Agrococcus sp. TF02-05]